MPPRKPAHQWAPSTSTLRRYVGGMTNLSPRVRHAVRLYTSGAVPTKKAAAEAVGMHPGTLSMYMTHSPAVKQMMGLTDSQIHEKAVNMSGLLHELSVRALCTVSNIMENGGSEQVKLKAAIDLLDRGPQTGKIQKTANANFTIDGEDAKALASALIASSGVTDRFRGEVQGDYEKVQTDSPADGSKVLPPGS